MSFTVRGKLKLLFFLAKELKTAIHVCWMMLQWNSSECQVQKHLGIHLAEQLDCNTHIKEISKANKGIVIIKKLHSKL